MRNDPTPPGRLHRLLLLDVGHNALSGGIPATIANVIRMLHALDLSFNQLSGPIPAELQGLCDLDRASLQMNYNSGSCRMTCPIHHLLTAKIGQSA